jgi:hypothetical protein
MPVLTSVLKTLKSVRSQEAVYLFEKTPPSEWQQRSEGLLGGASSSIEEETTEDEALELFLTHLRALKILTDDTPEDT